MALFGNLSHEFLAKSKGNLISECVCGVSFNLKSMSMKANAECKAATAFGIYRVTFCSS